jgi:hypothetical protein
VEEFLIGLIRGALLLIPSLILLMLLWGGAGYVKDKLEELWKRRTSAEKEDANGTVGEEDQKGP